MWWDWNQVGTLIGIITALNGGFLWASKRMMDAQRTAFADRVADLIASNAEQDRHIETIRADLAEFKLETSEQYIRRDDWIVYVGRMEQKIDVIWGYIWKVGQTNEGRDE